MKTNKHYRDNMEKVKYLNGKYGIDEPELRRCYYVVNIDRYE